MSENFFYLTRLRQNVLLTVHFRFTTVHLLWWRQNMCFTLHCMSKSVFLLHRQWMSKMDQKRWRVERWLLAYEILNILFAQQPRGPRTGCWDVWGQEKGRRMFDLEKLNCGGPNIQGQGGKKCLAELRKSKLANLLENKGSPQNFKTRSWKRFGVIWEKILDFSHITAIKFHGPKICWGSSGFCKR